MTFPDHFSRLAGAYSRFRPGYPQALFRHFASLCAEHDLAWDCGTGNGQAAAGLAAYFSRVVATDASSQQISHAQAHRKVEYRVAVDCAPFLASSSVDIVTAAQAVHWFDLNPFYGEVRRVLKPGGVVAIWTYVLPVVDAAIDAILQRFYQDTIRSYWPPERRHVDTQYRELSFPFQELPAPQIEMREEWDCDQYLNFLRTWSAVAKFLDRNGEDPVKRIEAETHRAWGEPRKPKSVRWPVALRLGRVGIAAQGRPGPAS